MTDSERNTSAEFRDSLPITVQDVGDGPIQTIDGRQLHAVLGAGKDFSTWIKDRIASYGFSEGTDFAILDGLSSPISGSAKSRSQPTKEYRLSIDMAKEIAMVDRSETGRAVRRYFLECERRAKEAVPQINVRDPASLTKIAIQLIEVNKELECKVAELAPKARFFENFAEADGLYGLQNAARVLGKGPNKFVGWLKQHFLFYQGGALVPKAVYRTMGVFEVKAEIVDDKARYRTYVTPKVVAARR